MPTPSNQSFRIAFGSYDLAIDRATLTYRLVETKTGTVWADGLPVGWVALEDRLTGGVSRYDLGQTTAFSIEEKAGPQGKQILFGRDCLGIPIDVYFVCSEREIQLVVEANRDSRTHRVAEACLLPGLCAVDDGARGSHLVLPRGEGALAFPRDVPADSSTFLPIWSPEDGVSMPFFGAVREGENGRSALALVTDSAYGALRLARTGSGSASLDAHYTRDPERRRLELRVVPLPDSDHVGVARVYREKIVGERAHVILRRKAREHTAVESLLGGALVTFPIQVGGLHRQAFAEAAEIARDLRNGLEVGTAVCLFSGWATNDGSGGPPTFPASVGAGGDIGLRQAADDLRALGYVPGVAWDGATDDEAFGEIKHRYNVDAILLPAFGADDLRENDDEGIASRWDDMDRRMAAFALAHDHFGVVGSTGGADWTAITCDFWRGAASTRIADVPLASVVYHDSVAAFAAEPLHPQRPRRFLRALLRLAPPSFTLDREEFFDAGSGVREYVRRTCAVLGPLHRRCFPAFLTAHRFLSADRAVEETCWSNGARVVINAGDAVFENDTLALPPGGFVAEHPQFVAHDALRFGDERFDASRRVWRTMRSRDDKPFADSADVERREFPAG